MPDHEQAGDELKSERDFYEANRAEYLKAYAGKYVLIKNRKLHGSFDTFDAAYNAGVDQFGNVPMFIRKVEESDPPVTIPALFLGLLGGHFSSGTAKI